MDEPLQFDGDEVQELLAFSLACATMVVLMQHAPEHENVDDAYQRLEGYISAIQIMYDSIPESISDVAHQDAHECIEESERSEELVQSFVEQLNQEL